MEKKKNNNNKGTAYPPTIPTFKMVDKNATKE